MVKKITVIGCGNMSRSLISGMAINDRADDVLDSIQFCFVDRNIDRAEQLAAKMTNALFSDDKLEMVKSSDLVMLAIKPQQTRGVCEEISAVMSEHAHVVSIVAGISCDTLQQWSRASAITRIMPNTPTRIGLGATAVFHNSCVKKPQRQLVDLLMSNTGVCVELDEEDEMHAVTAISGSGPAYFFSLIEAMQQAALDLGLNAEQAELLSQQTALGASAYLKQGQTSAAMLRSQVASPGGTTERAIGVLEKNQWQSILKSAIKASHQRSIELSQLFNSK